MTMDQSLQPLVLTAVFESEAQAWLEELRYAHFPPERNKVPAHLTLFHALPGLEASAIQAVLAGECEDLSPCSAKFTSWRFTGRGVARDVASPGLVNLRARLAARWQDWLTPQDQRPWRPHVTIQNKVDPGIARALHAELSAVPGTMQAKVVGLVLWRYLDGPWAKIHGFPFPAARQSPDPTVVSPDPK
jgi:2'-5' RNA ligase